MKFLKRNIFVIITFVIFMGALIFWSNATGSRNQALDAQKEQIMDLENQIAKMRITLNQQQTELVYDATGLDIVKADKHEDIIEEFLRMVCTWDSWEDYMSAREKTMQKYGFPEDGPFMKTFMPEVPNKQSEDGTNYNRIDTYGLNLSYSDVEVYVTGINEAQYDYFAIAKMNTSDNEGGNQSSYATFRYAIDEEGNIQNMCAAPVAMT